MVEENITPIPLLICLFTPTFGQDAWTVVTGKNGSGQEQQQRTVAKEVVIQFKCQACYKMFDEMEQLDEHENQCSMSLIDEVEMQDERIHMGGKTMQ